jgi:hypothetical protein
LRNSAGQLTHTANVIVKGAVLQLRSGRKRHPGGLNPALIQAGDQAIQRLVTAIHASPAWNDGPAAIVMVWDENDHFTAPETNKVVLTVDKNYGIQGKTSALRYTHFSLLKSLESAFILPCLNHACDANVPVMSDLFAAK